MRVLRADVPPDLLPQHAVANEPGDRLVRARRRLDRAGERCRRPCARGLDPARGRHAGGADRQPPVAFFIIKSSVNFVAVAVLGTIMAVGLVGPDLSPWLTAVPAAGALLVIAAVLLCRGWRRRATHGRRGADAQAVVVMCARRSWAARARGADRALERAGRDRRLGRLLLWDNAVLWATFHAFGYSPTSP